MSGNTNSWLSWLSWLACGGVILAMLMNLDSYRRPHMDRSYGSFLNLYFTTSLLRAEELEQKGSYRLVPEDRWPLLSGWREELTDTDRPRALAKARRVHLLVPVLKPRELEIRIQVRPLPAADSGREPIVVEYGVNGVALGQSQVAPSQPTVLTLAVSESDLFRGDNEVFLYRVGRQADPGAWLSLGWLEVVRDAARKRSASPTLTSCTSAADGA